MLRPPRWLAVLCILGLVAALAAPVAGGVAFDGILVQLSPLFGLVIVALVRISDEPAARPVLVSVPLPSRAPPRQPSSA